MIREMHNDKNITFQSRDVVSHQVPRVIYPVSHNYCIKVPISPQQKQSHKKIILDDDDNVNQISSKSCKKIVLNDDYKYQDASD